MIKHYMYLIEIIIIHIDMMYQKLKEPKYYKLTLWTNYKNNDNLTLKNKL